MRRASVTLTLTMLVVLTTLSWSVMGTEYKHGSCPAGYDCEYADRYPVAPFLVTGHTVHAGMTLTLRGAAAEGSPFPVGLPAPEPIPRQTLGHEPLVPLRNPMEGLIQSECVGWLDGRNLDVRPMSEDIARSGVTDNRYFSDMDEGVASDPAHQDYDPGRVLTTCLPDPSNAHSASPGRYFTALPTDFAALSGYFSVEQIQPGGGVQAGFGSYAVAVEARDCRPSAGLDFRFRGHLDFVDPNGIYHEVQEYDYVCRDTVAARAATSSQVQALFPWTYTDSEGWDGCDYVGTDGFRGDHFDLGHKCNGSIQDLFTERMWMTPIHEPVFDNAMGGEYTYALVVDTCSGWNVAETGAFPRGRGITGREMNDLDRTLDSFGLGQPLMEYCHDGSSFSFDDTGRERTTHDGPPVTFEEIRRGNAYDMDRVSETFGKHRTNCRHNALDWTYNRYPGEAPVGEDCYPEDHKSASIDLYFFDDDVTGGLFAANSNGGTGPDTYQGHGTPNGPNQAPPY